MNAREQCEFNETKIQINSADSVHFALDERTRFYFKKLGVHESFLKAFRYLSVGISQNSIFFLNWSLIKFIAEAYPDSDSLSMVTQILSYFPSEYKLLNYYFCETLSQPNLHFFNRFLLYQVNNVKNILEASASLSIPQKIFEIKTLGKQSISMARRFWTNPAVDISYFYEFNKINHYIDAVYHEHLEKWPNNSRLTDNYSGFLVEGPTDFLRALKVKYRSTLIEAGISSVIDMPFRSLMRSFPHYLKRNIIDLKGKIILDAESKKKSSGSQHSINTMASFQIEIDPEHEDILGKICFSYHRMRLAYQRAFEGHNSKFSNYLRWGLIFCFLIGIAMSLFMSIYFSNKFIESSSVLNEFIPLENFVISYLTSLDMLLIQQLHSISSLEESVLKQIKKPDGFLSEAIPNYSNDFNIEMDRWILVAMQSITDLLHILVVQATNGISVHKSLSVFVDPISKITYCTNDIPHNKAGLNTSIYGAAIYSVSRMRFLIQSHESISGKTEFCESVLGYQGIDRVIATIFQDIDKRQIFKSSEDQKSLLIISLICIIGYFVFCFSYLLIFIILSFQDLNKLLKLMQNVDPTSRAEAAGPLIPEDVENYSEEYYEVSSSSGLKPSVLIVLNLIFVLITIGMFLMIFLTTYYEKKAIQNNLTYTFLDYRRLGLSMVALIDATLYLANYHKILNDRFISAEYFKNNLNLITTSLHNTNHNLLGTSNYSSVMGEYPELDKYNLYNICDTFVPTRDLFDSYSCSRIIK
jgi:hypothetical protein